jgi:hypothetical protein
MTPQGLPGINIQAYLYGTSVIVKRSLTTLKLEVRHVHDGEPPHGFLKLQKILKLFQLDNHLQVTERTDNKLNCLTFLANHHF